MESKKVWLMWMLKASGSLTAAFLLAAGSVYWWWFQAPHELVAEVAYGQRDEQKLLLDVFRPPEQNGVGILLLVSGSWKSNHDPVQTFLIAPLLRRGYTVFAVRHQSQPDCLIGDIVDDIQRAVRFIRHSADTYGIDANRIGVTGGSSGGHLSLMLATRGGPGPADAADPIDRESSAVQCVACFFPVTDLLNLGESTENPGDGGPPINYKKGFGPQAETLEAWKVLGRQLSPIYHITSELPPIFIVHGDADTLVPLDQSERFVEQAKTVGQEVRLVVRPHKKHGWPTMIFDIPRFADWFDTHLLAPTAQHSQAQSTDQRLVPAITQ